MALSVNQVAAILEFEAGFKPWRKRLRTAERKRLGHFALECYADLHWGRYAPRIWDHGSLCFGSAETLHAAPAPEKGWTYAWQATYDGESFGSWLVIDDAAAGDPAVIRDLERLLSQQAALVLYEHVIRTT